MAEGLTDRDLAEQGIPIDHTEFATSIASDASSLFTRPVHKWLADSGATHNMTFNATSFINYTRGKLAIRVANKAILMAEGYGDVPLDLIQKDGSTRTIILREVWYVPQLSCNLISTKALGLDGITTVFEYTQKSFLL